MSQIKNIEIKNFKSIRHALIDDCRRVNVFIGYPNVGKSNVLEALGLFSIKNKTVDFKKLFRITNVNSLFFNGNSKEKVEVRINEYQRARMEWKKEALKIKMEFDGSHLGFNVIDAPPATDKGQNANEYFSFELDESLQCVSMDNNKDAPKNSEVVPVGFYQFKEFEKDHTLSGQRLNSPWGENLFSVIASNTALRNEVKELFDFYNLKFSFDTNSNEYKIIKSVGDDIFLISYSMIADTLQRLIFYKTAIKSNENTVLLFEEPEAHMFPAYIGKLTADISQDENGNQFFITTHSPFVLNDLMEDVGISDMAIYAIGYNKDNGETMIKRISEDEVNEIYQYGIDVFFNLENFLKDAV